jgi:hypothetical protein
MHAPPRTALLFILAACAPAPEAGPDTAKIQPLLAGVPDSGATAPQALAGAALAPVAAGAVRVPAWRRYVALVDKAASDPCPTASAGWTGERLFRRGDVVTLLGEKGVLPPALERFCLYTWAGGGSPAAPPGFKGPGADKVVRVDADREVVVPQAAYLGGDATVRRTLADAFLMAAGAVPGGAAGPSMHAGIEGPAKVAVVDTVGFARASGLDYAVAEARERHGLTMAEVIAALRCPNDEAGCRGQLFHAQAFPYSAASPLPQAGGGPLASMASLAHAIGEAVVRWRQGDMRTSPLIVNLSVGWDPRHGDALTPPGQEATHTDLLVTASASVPATVQAVHTAMVYATCLEVLAIAAAGNNTGAACEQRGLMVPASWERYPAPDRARCELLFGALPAGRAGDPAITPPTRSLLYAAGGVDAADRPIPNARPGASPPRVLAAFQAVVGAGARQTDAWTGTSIAAASLSALAAQIWSHHRVLTPHQVIALLDASRDATSTGQRRAPRLRAHDAFAHLCQLRPAGAPCANPYAPPTAPPQVATSASLAATSLSALQDLTCTTSTVQCGPGSATLTRCAGDAATAAAWAPPGPAEPWVRPQPDTPLCPVCPVRGGRLTLSLNPDFNGSGVALRDPVLEVLRPDGSYLGVQLAQVTVDAQGAEVDLARYRVNVGGALVDLASLLTTESIRSGVLGFTVSDSAGASVWLSSAVAIEP